jgi:hypothetical protein
MAFGGPPAEIAASLVDPPFRREERVSARMRGCGIIPGLDPSARLTEFRVSPPSVLRDQRWPQPRYHRREGDHMVGLNGMPATLR